MYTNTNSDQGRQAGKLLSLLLLKFRFFLCICVFMVPCAIKLSWVKFSSMPQYHNSIRWNTEISSLQHRATHTMPKTHAGNKPIITWQIVPTSQDILPLEAPMNRNLPLRMICPSKSMWLFWVPGHIICPFLAHSLRSSTCFYQEEDILKGPKVSESGRPSERLQKMSPSA